MRKHYPYEEVVRDQRSKVMEDIGESRNMDFDEYLQDRSSGINADPDEGFRDGVKSVKRMHPDHYIPNVRGCK